MTANTAALTAYEAVALRSFYNADPMYLDGDNTRATYGWDFAEAIASRANISLHAAAGVMSSLAKKGLVEISEYDRDDTSVAMTAAGFAAIEAMGAAA
jgi:DNA-binding MarR family transcriptional regulator